MSIVSEFKEFAMKGPNAEVLELGQHLPVAFARQDRPDDSLTCLPHHIGCDHTIEASE